MKEYDWLDIDEKQKSRVVQELQDWHQAEIQGFVTVIRGQRAEAQLPKIQLGWFDLFCHECGECECFFGTVEGFAAKLAEIGWAVENLERNQAMCPACQNDTSTYASQYEDNRGLLG